MAWLSPGVDSWADMSRRFWSSVGDVAVCVVVVALVVEIRSVGAGGSLSLSLFCCGVWSEVRAQMAIGLVYV